MTQLKTEDMDETYTFNTSYTTYTTMYGNTKHHEIARKGHHFYQKLGDKWIPAPSEAYCKEIFDLKHRIMELV